MVRDFLPSLSSLRAFQSAARHLSFTRAAQELNLTQSAVSRQIRDLESQFGVALFTRVRKRLLLTEAAAQYLPEVSEAIGRIQRATQRLLGEAEVKGVLNLAVPSTFGARWLIPRMVGFLAENRGASLNFRTRNQPFDLLSDGIDAAVYCCRESAWPGLFSEQLMDEEVVAVCHPALCTGRGALKTPADLQHATLLQITSRPNAWPEWLEAAGASNVNGLRGPQFELFSLAIQAAIARIGVALIPRFLVAQEIDSGQLRVPFAVTYRSPHRYYFVSPENRKDQPLLSAFRAWLSHTANEPEDPWTPRHAKEVRRPSAIPSFDGLARL